MILGGVGVSYERVTPAGGVGVSYARGTPVGLIAQRRRAVPGNDAMFRMLSILFRMLSYFNCNT